MSDSLYFNTGDRMRYPPSISTVTFGPSLFATYDSGPQPAQSLNIYFDLAAPPSPEQEQQ